MINVCTSWGLYVCDAHTDTNSIGCDRLEICFVENNIMTTEQTAINRDVKGSIIAIIFVKSALTW